MINRPHPENNSLKQFYLILFSFICLQTAYSQTVQTMEGTEFWLGFMDNSAIVFSPNPQPPVITEPLELSVLITSRVATSGTISIPALNWYHQFTVQGDSTLEIIVPKNLARHPNFNTIAQKGVHIVSKAPVSVAAYNFIPASADGSSIYPATILGSEYYLASYAPNSGSDITGKSEFLIVATADSTVIEITPKVALVGRPANVLFQIVLNKGETYQNRATSPYTDVSGTLVKGAAGNGTCKPFAVFSGSQSTYVPSNCWFSDHLYEQLTPTNYWGTQFFITPFALMTDYTLNIIAKTNNTQVMLNATGTPVTLSQGQSYKLNSTTARVITSSQPVSVFLFMQGTECTGGGYGDPSMTAINSSDHTINYAKFGTFNDSLIDTNYVNILVKTSERHSIYLDGTLIPDNSFSTFVNYTTMSYAKVPVSAGTHELESNYSFQGMLYGMGYETYTSYANNLGWYQPVQTLQPDQVICTTTDTLLSAPSGFSNIWWSAISAANDTIGVGPDLLVEANDPGNIYIAHSTGSAGCPVTSSFSVENPSTVNPSITASGTTVCSFSDVAVSIQASTYVPFTTEWSPAEQFANPHSASTTLSPEASGWYYATVSSLAPGCYSIEDSIFITVNGGEITETAITAADQQLCFHDTTSVEFTAYRKIGFDNFNGQIDAALWSQVNGAVLDNTCGSHNGQALYFSGATLRSAETVPLDVTTGGKLSFYLQTGSSASLCDDPEAGENILLQYSPDNGASWTTFKTLYENGYATFLRVEEDIPAAALSGSTKFRLIQPAFSGVNQDLWMLDHFLISKKEVSSPVSWSPATFLANSNSYTTLAYPETTTTYTVSLTDQGCTYSDSVLIVSDDFSATIESAVTCNSAATTLIAHVSDNDAYSYSWQSNAAGNYPNDSLIVADAQVVADTFTVEILSAAGCLLNESVIISPKYFEIAILGDTAICAGDTTVLTAGAFLNITDHFNVPAVDSDLWWNISGGHVSTNCSVYEGSNLYFGENVNRSCETKAFDFSNGGILSFKYAFGTGSGYYANSCSLPANNQYVSVEFSTDNGLTWSYLSSFGISNNFPTADFQDVRIELPAGASSPNTKFRWKQNNISSTYGSNWMLDNVSLLRRLPDATAYSWYDDQNNLVSTDSAITITQAATSDYTVQITDLQTNCMHSQSVTVKTGPHFSAGVPDVQLCNTDSVTFIPQPPAGEDYTYNWYNFTIWPILLYSNLSSDSIYSIYANTATTVLVQTNSTSGCSSLDTIYVTMPFDLEAATILGDTSLCSGAAGNLEAKLSEDILYPCQSPYDFHSFNAVSSTNFYGSVNGNAIVYTGGNPRNVIINEPIVNGGSLSFYVKSGDGISGDPTEPGDNLLVEYSTNNGTTWQFLSNVSTYQVFQFQHVTLNLPVAANSPATLIRFSQPTNEGGFSDMILLDEITVSVYSAVPLTYSWTTNNSVISTTESVNINQTAQSQVYAVTISDPVSACVFHDSITVESLSFAVHAGADTLICNNAAIALNGSTDCVSPYFISWTNPGNLSNSHVLQPQVTTTVPATYILYVSKDNCVHSDTVSVIVSNLGLDLADAATKCVQDTLLVDMTGAGAVNWTPATDIVNQGEVYGLYTNQSGDYFVSYEDVNGCHYEDSISIAVEQPITVTLPADSTICANELLLLIPESSSANPNFLWNNGLVSTDLSVSVPGIYWAEQSNSCGSYRDSIVVSNFAPLNCTISATDYVLSADGSFQSYQWIACSTGLPVPGETDQSFTPTLNGSYAVVVSDGNCQDTSNCILIDDLGLDDLISTNDLQLNYHSSTNELTVVFTNAASYSLELFDYSGKLIYEKLQVVSGETILLNCATGIYMVRIAEQTTRLYIR